MAGDTPQPERPEFEGQAMERLLRMMGTAFLVQAGTSDKLADAQDESPQAGDTSIDLPPAQVGDSSDYGTFDTGAFNANDSSSIFGTGAGEEVIPFEAGTGFETPQFETPSMEFASGTTPEIPSFVGDAIGDTVDVGEPFETSSVPDVGGWGDGEINRINQLNGINGIEQFLQGQQVDYGERYSTDHEDDQTVLHMVQEFGEESRRWRHLIMLAFQRIIDDLRVDHAKLSSILRHFEGTRRSP